MYRYKSEVIFKMMGPSVKNLSISEVIKVDAENALKLVMVLVSALRFVKNVFIVVTINTAASVKAWNINFTHLFIVWCSFYSVKFYTSLTLLPSVI